MFTLKAIWNFHAQVGCGAGNAIFPLVAAYPKLYVHACDFSPLAIELLKVCNSFYLVKLMHPEVPSIS